MLRNALGIIIVSLLVTGCGCSAFDKTGQLDPDGLDDADDAAEIQVDVDAPDVPDVPVEAVDAADGGDPPDDPVEEETGCGSDEECSDGEPCNGAETCGTDGECHDGTPLEDGSACVSTGGVDGICIEQVCRPPGCGDGYVTGSEECDDENTTPGDGCENDCMFTCHTDTECDDVDVCTDDTCAAAGTGQLCQNAFNTLPCNDLNDCTHTDACNGAGMCTGTSYICTLGVCEVSSACDGTGGCTITYASPGTGCSDLAPCTHTDVCDGSGGCSGTTYSCSPGTCEDASACDGSGGCTPTYSAPGTTCSDTYRCTTGDSCDGAGVCVSGSTLDDTLCGSGEICRPTCFPSSGCGVPPGFLDIKCAETTVLPADAGCTITLDGVTGQVPCLSCVTEVGMVTLSNDNFTGSGGVCGLGGWSMISGDNCSDRIDEGSGCTPGGSVRTCCSNASTIDDDLGGDCVLRTDRDTNCGGSGDSRQWRIERDYDTRGLADLELCFRIADWNATDNEGILVYAIDPTHNEQVFCLEGPPVTGSTPVDGVEWPYCVDLSATWSWVEDNPDLTLMFIAHSNDDGDVLFLDDIVLRGWSDTCAPTRVPVFTEDFDPCPGTDPIPSGWNGWTILGLLPGHGPGCQTVCTGGSAGGAVASNETWTMTHRVDTSALDGDVRLCFDVGDDNADWNEWISVLFDTGNGLGFQEAWYWENEWGTDGACRRVCLHLTDFDGSAARNPDLMIQFQLSSNVSDEIIFIDDIVVDGAVYCDGSGSVSTSSLVESGGASYNFDLVDDAGVPMGAYAVCTWDTATPPVIGAGGTWFMSP